MRTTALRKENFKSIYFALSLLVFVILMGVVGYIFIEDYSLHEAFFMTIITISTVGFREVHPLSPVGQVFTAMLIVISIGIFAYAVTTLTRYIVDGVLRNYIKDNKVKNRIEKLEGHVIVCGYGRNGQQAVEELASHFVTSVIVDDSDAIIDSLREKPEYLYIQGNATEDETLMEAKILTAKALITALPNEADNLFVVLTAREMNQDLTIISRASNFNTVKKLKSAGATNVIMPDKIGGQRMAKLVAQPDVVEFLDYIMLQSSDDVYIEEISCKNIDSCFMEKTIGEWGIRAQTGANVIGLKNKDNQYVVNPSPAVKITNEDQLFVLGNPEQIKKLREILNDE